MEPATRFFSSPRRCRQSWPLTVRKGEPPSPEVHLHHLLCRRCLFQLLPPDTSEPVAHLRLLSLLSHEPIPKHFNIIEKKGENAMSCNTLLDRVGADIGIDRGNPGSKTKGNAFLKPPLDQERRVLPSARSFFAPDRQCPSKVA